MADRRVPKSQEQLVKLDWNTFQLICERLEETGARYKSCEDLGFNYATVRDAIASATASEDLEWKALWDLSCAKHAERIEQELLRRAVNGVTKKVWGRVYKDRDGEIGEEVHYSDALLLAANKAYNERYRERSAITLGSGLEVPDIFAQLTPAARKAVRDIIVMDLAEQAAIHGRSEEVLETERQGVKLLKPPPEPEAKKAARKKRGED
jgi:hypothetical protein